MTLISSISGIRGTIGGKPGENLTPPDIVAFTAAYASWISGRFTDIKPSVVVGRDGRTSGQMLENLVSGTLSGMGLDVKLLGLASTPTVELAVEHFGAQGGIILTASHNPAEWNALKLLDEKGEFIGDEEGKKILGIAVNGNFRFADSLSLGKINRVENFDFLHIEKILELDLVNTEAIAKARFRVAVDGINSVGGKVIPELLYSLGVSEVYLINGEPDGRFAHPPEPLPENLKDICRLVKERKADLGIVVDPDVDRLALVDDKGNLFGEEYTLVAVADYVLGYHPGGNTVSNLSSTRALADITLKHGGKYYASAVGEVNVVSKMKETNAIIGGEGNGGVIYPALHYGRDALAGVALFLSHLAVSGNTCSALRDQYPRYHMVKQKAPVPSRQDPEEILEEIASAYDQFPLNREDGLRIDFPEGWIHLRKSNTEPILRIYAEAAEPELAMEWIKAIRRHLDS